MKELRLERDGKGIATLVLDRPERKNAITVEMFAELRRIFEEVAVSETDRVLVVTGAGGAFCSGADLTLGGGTRRHILEMMRSISSAALALYQLSRPVIAKVDGIAAGAGWNLALGCDLVVASDRSRFSQIFARRGLSVDFGGSWLLPRLVGLHRAKELALLADVISAQEAERMGLVNRVVPAGELDALVAGWSERLAAGPPLALSMTKRLLADSLQRSFESALEAESTAQSVNSTSRDGREGLAAFAERREPRFEGL